MENYFELFSLDVEFAIDLKALDSSYKQQITKFHPDKFVTKSVSEQSNALQNTSLINTAIDTLKSPLKRATYLLELQGINAFNEKDTSMDTAFLLSQIELREKLELIESERDEIGLDGFIENIASKITENVEQLEQLFIKDEFGKIKNLVRELKFYIQLNTHSSRLMDEWL
ncbi:MAG: Fe-S protein assembly co-chaperone HscB [PS1 clade bacterium]|jgi:molecular chaperone HscB